MGGRRRRVLRTRSSFFVLPWASPTSGPRAGSAAHGSTVTAGPHGGHCSEDAVRAPTPDVASGGERLVGGPAARIAASWEATACRAVAGTGGGGSCSAEVAEGAPISVCFRIDVGGLRC